MRGQMVFGRGHKAVGCVLLDLSGEGARLRTTDWLGVPDRFDLRIENGQTHGAEVCYRDLDSAGVRFVAGGPN